MLASLLGRLFVREDGCVILSNGRNDYATIWPRGSTTIERGGKSGVLVPRARGTKADFYPLGEWVEVPGGATDLPGLQPCSGEAWAIGKLAE